MPYFFTAKQMVASKGEEEPSVLEKYSLQVESHNSFPTGAGLASSASGCSAVGLFYIISL